ncbi:DNA polymerase II [Thalassotalea ponticola]|uniref:DNA polymerase II n=1 Tax=Thalassotalea ponticola TaxID=1523392 RepID=UPI0025B390EF|nr:DNA polymerase II [Thalassotalea ponticola]MDN3651198.1 DNA polymerase II [Thalassotalea ponticola]
MVDSIKKGFVLTRQSRDVANKLQLIYWLQTNEGPAKLIIDDEKAIFFVEANSADEAVRHLKQAHISFLSKPLELRTFEQDAVVGFYFSSLSAFYRARDILKQAMIKCYEDDIRPEDRYLSERFINGAAEFIGQRSNAHGFEQVKQAKLRRSAYSPALTMLSIDIECSFDGELYSIGAYAQDNSQQAIKRVLMIGEPEPNAESYIEWVEDEYDLLMRFIDLINELNPDILIGWNVINFDFKLLQKRYDLNNIKFSIGRDASPPSWRANRLANEQHFIDIAGRVVIDGIDMLRSATYSFTSFALENVAQELLGIGKAIDDVDNRGAEITRKFLYHKQALAEYNLEDCRLVWLIFEKTQLLNYAVLRSQLTGLELDRIGGSVAAFTNLYLPKLHRAGYIAPNMGDGERDLVSPGGFVMDSVPGLYKNVLVLDFKSLYPSIIRTFKIDPMGMVEGIKDHLQNLDDEVIEGFDGAWFSRKKHFLPTIIERLWRERDKAKAQKNAPLSQAIKIIMNSFYGVLGSTGCRFFDPRLSGAITKRSHQLLNLTKQWIENQGYQVIYGDTDSIFVSIGEDKSDQQSQQIGQQMVTLVNANMAEYLQQKFAIESALEIEFETHFHTFLMPTVRGQDIGTKKRYAGLVGRGTSERLIFKGLESVRTDWTELAKEFQRSLYLKVFKGEPVDAYIRDIVERTLRGEFDDKLIFRKRIRQQLSLYQKNVPPHVKAARDADLQNERRGKPLRYQHKSWIEYAYTKEGPQAVEYLRSDIDYPVYIERQLAAVADGILPFIGKNFNKIIDDQLQLF